MNHFGDSKSNNTRRKKIIALVMCILILTALGIFVMVGTSIILNPATPNTPPLPRYTQSDVKIYMTANDTDEVWFAEPEFSWWDGVALGTFNYHQLPLNQSYKWFKRVKDNSILSTQVWFREKYLFENNTWYYPDTHGPYFIVIDYTQVPLNYTFILDRHTVYVEAYFQY